MTARPRPRHAKSARPPRGPVQHLHFPGSGLSIRMTGAQPVREALAGAIKGWAPQILPAPRPGDLCAALTGGTTGGRAGFTARSPFYEGDLTGLDTAGAACALIADLSEGYLAGRPGCLALHCGAFRFDGPLILLTGPMRAGKSTLIARLTAEPDVSIFCDDVLPLTPDFDAIALGIAPRLRLPLPQDATEAFRRHVACAAGPRDARYAYLATPNLAPHGQTARPGTLIVLDRRGSGAAQLHRMDPDQAMHHLLAQNMGDLGDAERAFALGRHLVGQLACLRLVYADLEEATALLRRAFAGDAPACGRLPLAPPLPGSPSAPTRSPTPLPPDLVAAQSAGLKLRRMGDGAFLWSPGAPRLWHLNPIGHAVWALLELPGSARDLAQTLSEVFPAIPETQLTADIAALLGDLQAEGFVTTLSGRDA
ncbi:PqqD family peptide modification chaperone [Paracoccus nototheniae]|uniref:PqqD family peptide modification chaperone n=1 Tax=Paracoccus nototheniae TaxID=2489002 RepID=A0ABW4DYW0_9RHOB|nr:PqqD family peptide modification chaperone [Paracoccus nototheniae]